MGKVDCYCYGAAGRCSGFPRSEAASPGYAGRGELGAFSGSGAWRSRRSFPSGALPPGTGSEDRRSYGFGYTPEAWRGRTETIVVSFLRASSGGGRDIRFPIPSPYDKRQVVLAFRWAKGNSSSYLPGGSSTVSGRNRLERPEEMAAPTPYVERLPVFPEEEARPLPGLR